MREVLFVSKPVAPPWNDSSKNLVRDVAGHLRRHKPLIMGREGQENPIGAGRVARVYRADGTSSFSPRVRDNLDVLCHLLWDADADIWHLFFAPNRRASTAGRFATWLRRAPCVHTVCSMPAEDTPIRPLLFADVTVVLSRHSEERFRAESRSVRRIPPCVPNLDAPSETQRGELRARYTIPRFAPIWIYPGDLEHGDGAELAMKAFASAQARDAHLLMACRDKTARSGALRRHLVSKARELGIGPRTHWIGETPHIHDLLGLSDVIVLPSRSSFAKMDYPLVALEARCMARPVIVSSKTPAAELAEAGGALAVEPDPDAVAAAAQSLLDDDDTRARLCERARALVLNELSPANVAESYERIYEELHG
jgi:glycosyltransferase involved in cell wall biosynthesis